MPKVATTRIGSGGLAHQVPEAVLQIVLSLSEIVWYLDADGHFRFCNAAFEAFTGYREQDLYGLRPPYPDKGLSRFISDFMAETRTCRDAAFEISAFHPQSGERIDLEIRELAIRDEEGAAVGYACIATDVTRRNAMEIELKANRHALLRQAFYDPLTGLPNHAHYVGTVAETIREIVSGGGRGSLMLIDLDRFGAVNESLGHAAGDCLLVELAERLRHEAQRSGSYLARLNSDEFLLIRERHGAGDDEVAQDCAALLEGLSRPFFSERKLLAVTASVGVALFPDHAEAADALLDLAYKALFAAKRSGHGSWRIFDSSLSSLSEDARDRYALESDLHRSIATDDFATHYQAKVDLRTGTIVGAESLMRWNHPVMGSIPPSMFIPLAEETGLIIPLGERILMDACRFARQWNESSDLPRRVSVNLSPRQVLVDGFRPLLEACLSRTGCRAEWLELDMTESLLMSDEKRVDRLMQWLHGLGVKVAVDDFGTGHSAISSLTYAPVATVKIDRSLVAAAATSGKAAAMVRSIAGLAKQLGITCLAEGIEHADDAALMRAFGCDEGQGFLWNRPMPQDDFLTWAATWSQRS